MNFIIQIIVGVVLSIASTLLQQAFAPKQQNRTGTRGAAQIGGKVPQYFLIGTVGEPGKHEYRNSWGNSGGVPNAYNVDVYSFGDLPITALTKLFVSGVVEPIATTGKVTQGYPTTGDKAGKLWIDFLDGTQTTSNSYLTGKFGSDPDRPWLTDMVGRGVPYLTATARWDEKLWTGFPVFMAEFQGIKLYDRRKDSSAGGSGTQRWADPSTWAFSDNNAVIIENIERGIYYNSPGATTLGKHIWGGKKTDAELPYAVWAAAMDKCDAAITLNGGGTEKQFRGGRRISLNERPADVIKEFLIGANARISHASDGSVYILVGVPDEADGAFTDDDVLGSEPLGSIPFPNLDSIINGATATYREPSQAWEDKETAPYYRSDLEEEDDGRQQIEGLDLGTTFSGSQAQRVIKAVIEEGRRFETHVVALPPEFAQYRPLQVLAWTSDRRDYSAKKFLITARTRTPWGQVVFGLQEIDPADHAWTPGTDERPLSFAPVVTNRPAPQEVSGPSAAPVPGTLAYDVFWSSPSVADDVQFVRVSHQRPDGTLPYTVLVPKPDLSTGAARIPVSLELSGQPIEVQIEYLPYSGRPTVASTWMPVLIAEVKIPPGMIDLSNVAKDVFGQMGLKPRQIIEQFKQMGTLLEETDRENYTKREALFREISVELEGLEASFSEVIEVALGPGGAIAQKLESLYAAQGGNTAQVNVRWVAEAGPTGYGARYVQQAAVDDGEFRAASQWLDVPTSPLLPTMVGWAAGRFGWYTSAGVLIVAMDENGVQRSANGAKMINWVTGAERNDAV